jgi:hypothetical protein
MEFNEFIFKKKINKASQRMELVNGGFDGAGQGRAQVGVEMWGSVSRCQ